MSTAPRTPVRIPSIEPAAMNSVKRGSHSKDVRPRAATSRVVYRGSHGDFAARGLQFLAKPAALATMPSPPSGLGQRRPEEHGKQGAGSWFST